MDDEQELLPDELDALIDDLQKGASVMLPASHQPTVDFLQSLVNSSHSTELDPAYATRLDHRLKRSAALMLPRGMAQVWKASLHAGQQWRRLALAFTSVMLVSVFAISSLVSPHIQPVTITPPLANTALDEPASTYLSSNSPNEIASLSATKIGTARNTAAIQAVQAPEPPHTPLPEQSTPGELPASH